MIRAQQETIKLLHSWVRFLGHIADRWETAGYEIPIEQIRDVLFVLELLIDMGVFEKSDTYDRRDIFEVDKEFAAMWLHDNVKSLRRAATPVLEDRAADREVQQLRNTFAMIDTIMRLRFSS